MPELALIVGLAFVLYLFTVLRTTGLLNANALFVYVQTLLALGTFRLVDPHIEAEAVYGNITAWAVVSYMVVSAAVMLHRPRVVRVGGAWVPPLRPVRIYVPTATTWIFTAISILIVALYYRSVGASALLEGIRNTLTGGDADIAGIRLSAYSGDRYLFPGFVNQFKNALLPALVAVIITYWAKARQRHRLGAALLVGFTIFGLVGTGQRGAFIQVSVAIVIYLFMLHGNRLPKSAVKLVVAAGLVLVAATLALGRNSAGLGSDSSLFEHAWAATVDLVKRVTEQQQNGGIIAFRYVYEQPIQWGGEWLQAFTGLLPGAGGTDLPSRVFATVYGSTRGTISPSIWGSIYHNFGMLGIAVIPALLAVLIAGLTRLGALDRERNTVELVGSAGVATTIGMWAAGTPVTPLNNGFAMYALLWYMGAVHLRGPATGPEPAKSRTSLSRRTRT